jgi:hypothetical protein
MGFRFQKRIRILPGLRVNLSKTGLSTSFGGKGLTVNIRGDRVKTTVGAPGSGLSYSDTSKTSQPWLIWVLLAAAAVVLWLVF